MYSTHDPRFGGERKPLLLHTVANISDNLQGVAHGVQAQGRSIIQRSMAHMPHPSNGLPMMPTALRVSHPANDPCM